MKIQKTRTTKCNNEREVILVSRHCNIKADRGPGCNTQLIPTSAQDGMRWAARHDHFLLQW